MKLCRYAVEGGSRVGVVEGPMVRDAGTDLFAPRPGAAVGRLDSLTLLAPVEAPSKVVCVGRNYAAHAKERAATVPDRPQLFAKWANAVVGPGAPVVRPSITRALDWEAELVVVIGRRARRVAERAALDHVYGYTCGNDITARDLQDADTQWVRGKALDTFAPLGPWIVTADEIPDPQSLRIRCFVNGVLMQDDTTAHMLFPVAHLIAFASEAITLEAGDVIFTGTPPGVGHGRTPPVALQPGDRVRVDIEGIGALENPIVAVARTPTG